MIKMKISPIIGFQEVISDPEKMESFLLERKGDNPEDCDKQAKSQ
jgi:hypothetical protein